MFSTFVGTSHVSKATRADRPGAAVYRPKRVQVSRACEWCRVHRTKCDDSTPCSNCSNKGVECSRQPAAEIRTLSQAIREIGRLKQRVKTLENDIENHECPDFGCDTTSSPASPLYMTLTLDALSKRLSDHRISRQQSSGTHMSAAQTNRRQYYGPSSSFLFINRLGSFLRSVLQLPADCERCMHPNAACQSFASPTTADLDDATEELDKDTDNIHTTKSSKDLTPLQEGYFLDHFWQSYHCMFQIIDEHDFREHYKSLWAGGGTRRTPSALVDIVLALCMQFRISFLPRSTSAEDTQVDSNDATISGRFFYRRSQLLLTSELESPTIATIQCQIFSAIYLCNASFLNMAHVTIATAVRTAQVLGLHLEPSESLSRRHRELHKRIWWSLYALDVKTSMKLGRPWLVQLSQVACSLPADDHELALISSSNFASIGPTATWLTYCSKLVNLHLAVENIHTSFYSKCEEVLNRTESDSIYYSPETLEECSKFLSDSMDVMLKPWVDDIPDILKIQRRDSETPFSRNTGVLIVETFAPLWLQRQRLLLELLYHNLCMNLYRPFICFNAYRESITPLADTNANRCVEHAQVMTLMMHQMFHDNEILCGWQETFQWQWNATLTLVGFILAYPGSPNLPSTRKTVDSAIDVFEKLGSFFAQAASAAQVTRYLVAKADFLTERFRQGDHPPYRVSTEMLGGQKICSHTYNTKASDQNVLHNREWMPDMDHGSLDDFMDLAFPEGIDASQSLRPGSHDISDLWGNS